MIDWCKKLFSRGVPPTRGQITPAPDDSSQAIVGGFSGRDGASYIIAIALFLAAFLVPLGILGFFGKGPFNWVSQTQNEVPKRNFSKLVIRGPDSYIQVTTTDPNGRLGPIVGKDMLVLIWLKLNALQTDDRRAVVMLQSQVEQKKPPGFGLAFMKTSQGLRPEIYWKTAQDDSSGGWLSFEDLDADLTEPVMIALSVRGGRILGLHQVQRGHGEKNSVRLLGGADIGQYGELQGTNSLLIGAPDHSNFRGDVLGVLIQSAKEIPSDLNTHLKTIDFWPQDAVKTIEKADLQLFLDGAGQVAGIPLQPLRIHRVTIKPTTPKPPQN